MHSFNNMFDYLEGEIEIYIESLKIEIDKIIENGLVELDNLMQETKQRAKRKKYKKPVKNFAKSVKFQNLLNEIQFKDYKNIKHKQLFKIDFNK